MNQHQWCSKGLLWFAFSHSEYCELHLSKCISLTMFGPKCLVVTASQLCERPWPLSSTNSIFKNVWNKHIIQGVIEVWLVDEHFAVQAYGAIDMQKPGIKQSFLVWQQTCWLIMKLTMMNTPVAGCLLEFSCKYKCVSHKVLQRTRMAAKAKEIAGSEGLNGQNTPLLESIRHAWHNKLENNTVFHVAANFQTPENPSTYQGEVCDVALYSDGCSLEKETKIVFGPSALEVEQAASTTAPYYKSYSERRKGKPRRGSLKLVSGKDFARLSSDISSTIIMNSKPALQAQKCTQVFWNERSKMLNAKWIMVYTYLCVAYENNRIVLQLSPVLCRHYKRKQHCINEKGEMRTS